MTSPGAIRAGRAYVELFADDSRLVRGLRAASAKLKAWGATVTSIGLKIMAAGTAITAPLALATRQFMGMGDQLQKMSIRTGVSVEALSELRFAAEQSGTSLEDVGATILRMNRRLGRVTAGQGTTSQVEAMEALGLSVEDLLAMNPEQRFMAFADAIANYGDQTAAAGLAQRVLGMGVDELLPLLLAGEKGIRGLREEARKLGFQVSQEDADAAADLTDAWHKVTTAVKVAAIQVGAALAPALQSAAEWMAQWIRPTIDWIKANQDLIATTGKVAAAVTAAGAVIAGAGKALSVAGTAAGAFASVLGVVGSAIGLLLSPLGLAVAAIGGIVYYSGAGGKALEWLADRFAHLRDFAGKAWQGISDAIAAGDFGLAFEVAWASIRVVWTAGLVWLQEKWDVLAGWWSTASMKLASRWIDVMAEIKKAWNDMTMFLVKHWENFKTSRFTEIMTYILLPIVMGKPGFHGDVEEARAGLRRQFEAERESLPDRTAQIEREAEAKKKAIEEERRIRQDALNDQQKAEERQRKRRIAEAKREADEARRRWEESIEAAARKRAELERGEGAPGLGRPGEPDIPAFAGAEAAGGLIAGTFGKFALGGMGMGRGPAERTADATERAAEHLRHIRQDIEVIEQHRAVFGP